MAIAERSRIVEGSIWAAARLPNIVRRRAMLLLGVAAMLVVSLLGLARAVPEFGGAIGDLRSHSPTLMAMLAERSPGARTTAELTKLKKRRAAAVGPTQRALGKIFRPDQQALFKALTPPVPLASDELLNLAPLATIAPTAIPGLIVPGSGVPPVIVTPPGGIVSGDRKSTRLNSSHW